MHLPAAAGHRVGLGWARARVLAARHRCEIRSAAFAALARGGGGARQLGAGVRAAGKARANAYALRFDSHIDLSRITSSHSYLRLHQLVHAERTAPLTARTHTHTHTSHTSLT
jgi:hypothetical protein